MNNDEINNPETYPVKYDPDYVASLFAAASNESQNRMMNKSFREYVAAQSLAAMRSVCMKDDTGINRLLNTSEIVKIAIDDADALIKSLKDSVCKAER